MPIVPWWWSRPRVAAREPGQPHERAPALTVSIRSCADASIAGPSARNHTRTICGTRLERWAGTTDGHGMTTHGPGSPAPSNGTNGETDPAGRLERLRVRTRQLERQRIVASPTMTRAGLVALDVELCRVEAATRMLAPGGSIDVVDPVPILGGPWREPATSAHPTRDMLCERTGTTPRSDRSEDRGRPSWTSIARVP